MASSNWAAELRRLHRSAGWWPLAALIIGLSWAAGSLHRDALLTEIERQARQELDLYVANIEGQFDRFAYLPPLLADDFRLQSLLIAPRNRDQRDRVNRFLSHVNSIAGSLDVYLMDADGVTLAASNWQDELTFVGQDFGFRPYFTEAMRGRAGRYYALGTTSGRRGYYFSYPVGDIDDPLGVVVVKIGIDSLEDVWRDEGSELLITDPDGVIFLSTRPAWRYRTVQPLDPATIERIHASRRYPDAVLSPLFYRESRRLASGARLLQLGEPGGAGYIGVATDMPQADWRVQLVVSQRVIAPQVWQTRLFAMSLLLLLATVGGLYAARRRRLRERDEERRIALEEALVELEHRVDQRTSDLTRANRLLRHEVEEHERTRDELIQAAKLAALGQMSAGINHELNQPLAAIRTYADNARTYLARENLGQAGWNLQQISELTGRMAQISGQLKVFSRKSSGQRLRVSVRSCLDGALRILRARVEETGAELVIELAADLYVAADMVQLEQVLVNLIGNACDALHGAPVRRIAIRAWLDGDRVRIQIRDSGQGIAAANMAQIFDPFFTTTDSGLGLGLSISHTIAQRLGGTLTAGNAAEGGAVFTLTLAAWDDEG